MTKVTVQTHRCPRCDYVFTVKTKPKSPTQKAKATRTAKPMAPTPRHGQANPIIAELARWSVGHILSDVESEFGIPAYMICSRSRMKNVARARHTLWMRLRDHGFSWNEIAHICGVDHTTVMTAVKRLRAEQEQRDESEE